MILKQAKDLGTIVREEEKLKESISSGRNVAVYISETCRWCQFTLEDWYGSRKEIKSYLKKNDIKLLFIEKHMSPEICLEEGVSEFPTTKFYDFGKALITYSGFMRSRELIERLDYSYKK